MCKWLMSLKLFDYYEDRMMWQSSNFTITLNLLSENFHMIPALAIHRKRALHEEVDSVLSSCFFMDIFLVCWHWTSVPGTKSIGEVFWAFWEMPLLFRFFVAVCFVLFLSFFSFFPKLRFGVCTCIKDGAARHRQMFIQIFALSSLLLWIPHPV